MGPVIMTPLTIFAVFLSTTVGQGAFVQDDELSPDLGFNCPMIDIDFQWHDVDEVDGIDDWKQCGHLCNLVSESTCKFWTLTWDNRCILKSSNEGAHVYPGAISGQRGCEE